MTMQKTKKLVSILMESPLYLTTPVKERQSLIKRMAESYPFIIDRNDEEDVGYESSWAEVMKTK